MADLTETRLIRRVIGFFLSITVLMLLSGAAAVSSETVYPYTPGEIMYLAGIERAAYRDGVRYSLYDIILDIVDCKLCFLS